MPAYARAFALTSHEDDSQYGAFASWATCPSCDDDAAQVVQAFASHFLIFLSEVHGVRIAG